MSRFVRSPDTDAALDGVLSSLRDHGFIPPHEPTTDPQNRDALADALVQAAIDYEIRIRIDKEGGR